MFDAGARVGPFEILSPIDIAGIGEVYRARDHEHDREVALHVVRADFGANPPLLDAFHRRVRAAVDLRHPNLLQIHDVGTDAHAAYIVSEPIHGETLRARLVRRSLSLGAAARIGRQVGQALAMARKQHLAHGDLTPDHVVLRPDGRAVVIGLGWAAPTRFGRPRSDRLALAALLTEMAGAIPPRERVGLAAAAAAVLVMAFALPARWDDARSPAPVRPAEVTRAIPPTDERRSDNPSVDAPPVTENLDLAPPVPDAPAVAIESRVEPPDRPGPQPIAPPPALVTPAPVRAPVVSTPPAPRDDRDTASLVTEASVRANEFDLAGASELLAVAAKRGDAVAHVAASYIRGLVNARDAFEQGGAPDTLAPVREAMTALEAVGKGRPGSAEVARLTLQAAAAAAQSERDEMRLYIESAMQMESLQRAAGLPGAPMVTASETAGDLWFQLHRYEDARRAYTEAAERVGSTLRILAGLGRTARRLNDMPAACGAYRKLLDAWGARPGLPVEIAEARAYIGGCGSTSR